MKKIIISIIIAIVVIVVFVTMASADTTAVPEKQLEVNQFGEVREATVGSTWIIATKAQNKAFYNPGEEFKEKNKENIDFEKVDFFHHRFLQEVTFVKWAGGKYNYRTKQEYGEKKFTIDKVIMLIVAFLSFLALVFALYKKKSNNEKPAKIAKIIIFFIFLIILASYITIGLTFDKIITLYSLSVIVIKLLVLGLVLGVFISVEKKKNQEIWIIFYSILLLIAVVI